METTLRFPTKSTHFSWTEDEVAGIKTAAEALLQGWEDGDDANKAAAKFCDDFYRLTRERLRSPGAIRARAYLLGLGVPGAVMVSCVLRGSWGMRGASSAARA